MSLPLVSVIVTCFNREAYLREALDSILGQSFRDFEIVLVDDGSTDASAGLALSYGPKLRYHYQNNQGAAAAKNVGVELSLGKYLSFLDSDDLWTPDKLALQVGYLNAHSEASILYAHAQQFLSPELSEEAKSRLHCPPQAMPAPVTGTVLLARAAFDAVGPFRTDLQVGIDIEWNLRARAGGRPMVTLPDVLLHRRIHATNSGYTQRDHKHQHVAIVKEHLERMRMRKSQRSE